MTALLSPVACVAAKSPISWLVTFTSVILCTGVNRSTCTSRTSALPYWLGPNTIAMGIPPKRSDWQNGADRPNVRSGYPALQPRATFRNRDLTPAHTTAPYGSRRGRNGERLHGGDPSR